MRRLVIAVLLLTACGDDDAGDPSRYVSVDQYSAVAKASWCSYYTQCGYFTDHEACMSARLFVNADLSPSIVNAIKAGRVAYNGNNAKACLDATATATCDKTDDAGRVQPRACREIFQGTLAADAACYLDAECISGNCQAVVADGICEPGKCVGDTPPSTEPAANGEPCNFVSGCAPGSRCNSTTDVCETLHGTGMDCVTTADCAYGLGCAGNPRTCKPLPALGQPCPDGECRDDGTRCTASGCVAIGLTGATCNSGSECSIYYTCDFSTMKCKRGPVTGEACPSGNQRCFDASFCDSSTLKCVPYRGPGESCTSSLQCASGSCDSMTSQCMAPTTCL